MTLLRDAFDGFLCLNLPTSKDRRVAVEREFEAAGILDKVEFYTALGGADVKPTKGWYGKITPRWPHARCNRTYALVTNYRNMMDLIMKKGWGTTVIFQDDVIFPADFEKRFASFWRRLPKDWQSVNLMTNPRRARKKGTQIDGDIWRIKGSWSLVGTGFKREIVPQMRKAWNHSLQHATKAVGWSADSVYGRAQRSHVCYMAIPRIVGHAPGRSDLRQQRLSVYGFAPQDRLVKPTPLTTSRPLTAKDNQRPRKMSNMVTHILKRHVAHDGCTAPRVAVETGTYKGKTTRALAEQFAKVVTVELSPTLWKAARQDLAVSHPNVTCLQGRSEDQVPVLAKLYQEPVLWYLDAHWSPLLAKRTVGVARESPFPLWEELDAIATRQEEDIIVIDDVCLFGSKHGGSPEWRGLTWDGVLDRVGRERVRCTEVHRCHLMVFLSRVPEESVVHA